MSYRDNRPTIEDVRDNWIERQMEVWDQSRAYVEEEFDAWLAAHDAEVAASTLEKASTSWQLTRTENVDSWLKNRAEVIRSKQEWKP